jgi:lipopolysaccharide biosynthesis protein
MPRLIAFHLPQFHPIPENDEWWGKGFTEWTNVTKAQPLVRGHYQPRLPADLGFYDLRLPETREAQAALAKAYGIYGFCYYHYWFAGKRLLERPVEDILHTGKPDFPYMLCWANENWSRRWDGSDDIVLIQQNYSVEDAREHIKVLLPHFLDPRYIRIDGKPFFLIYRSQIIPNLKEYVDIFRQEAKKAGIELYIGRVESHFEVGLQHMNDFEAAVEFQPFTSYFQAYRKSMKWRYFFRNTVLKQIRLAYRRLNGIKGRYDQFWFIEYPGYVDFLLRNYRYPTDYKRYPCATPDWDNTARRGNASFFFKNSTPEKFEEWLRFHRENYVPHSEEEDYLFVNAWNEWAEGNCLEPSRKWGHRYLEAVRNVFSNS